MFSLCPSHGFLFSIASFVLSQTTPLGVLPKVTGHISVYYDIYNFEQNIN